MHYQPGHGYTSMGETKEADGKFFNSGNKFSKDRFLPVGPLHVETEQLIDITGDKMHLIHDHTAYPEPHDAIIVRADLVKTRQVSDMNDFPNAVKTFEENRIERDGKKVMVFMTDAKQAFFVLDSKKTGSMGPTLASFVHQQDADNFAKDFGGKVLSFDKVTLDMVDLGGGVIHDEHM